MVYVLYIFPWFSYGIVFTLINAKTYFLMVLIYLIQIPFCRVKFFYSNWMYFMAQVRSQNNVIILHPQLAQYLHSQFLNTNSLFGLDMFQPVLRMGGKFCVCTGCFIFYAQMGLFYITAFSSAFVMHTHLWENAQWALSFSYLDHHSLFSPYVYTDESATRYFLRLLCHFVTLLNIHTSNTLFKRPNSKSCSIQFTIHTDIVSLSLCGCSEETACILDSIKTQISQSTAIVVSSFTKRKKWKT